MQLLLHTNPREPVTHILLKNREALDVYPLHIKDLLGDVTIFDEIQKGIPKIHWTLPDGAEITNSHSIRLVNRVFECPLEMFSEFKEEDRLYAQCEFYAYLTFAIDAFPVKTSAPSPYSLSGGFYPLPKLWKDVEKLCPTISTPTFFLGCNELLPSNCKMQEMIHSNLYDYYHWKVGDNGEDKGDYIFAIELPKGDPYLVLIIGNQVSIHPMDNASSLDLSRQMQEELISKALILNQQYKYLFADVLFFISDDKVTFGMIHNVPLAGSRTEGFEKKVMTYFQNLA